MHAGPAENGHAADRAMPYIREGRAGAVAARAVRLQLGIEGDDR